MNSLIIDIRDNCLRAVLSCDGTLEYCRTFDFEPYSGSSETESGASGEPVKNYIQAPENPYLIYYDDTHEKGPWELALKPILAQIYGELKYSVDSTHLILPSDDVAIETHQLPKMTHGDALKLIGRKISAETHEEFPPFTIVPAGSDQKTQTWCSLYVPTRTLKEYRKAFSSCRVRLSSITTPVNAMINAFSSVREAIFNAHAIFEIQRGFIEAFYISSDGVLHFQRLPYSSAGDTPENTPEELERSQKQKIFKILNTIFSINSNYQSSHPATPVQMAWVCGLETGLEEIATAIKEAMGIEVGIAPAMPTGLQDESGYVPLSGFAAALDSNSATTYVAADLFRRFPLRRTSGILIYAVTACAAIMAITLTEREYRTLLRQARPPQSAGSQPNSKAQTASVSAKSLESLKKLTARNSQLYPLFRELATDLPDGVYLENFEYHLKNEKGHIDITAVAKLDNTLVEQHILTRVMTMFDRSPTLKHHQLPVITVYSRDNERYMKISVISEVNAIDSAK